VERLPEFRPSRLLERLSAHGADFVVVGGYAAIAHGSAQITNDLDICIATDPANLEVIGSALVDLQARLRGVSDEVPFVPDAASLKSVQLLALMTSEGPLDILTAPHGSPGYSTLRRRAARVNVAGIGVLVASLEDLMSMKHAIGRPKDLITLEELEVIARLRKKIRPIKPDEETA
jgi:predicted nucleotidyltransferase